MPLPGLCPSSSLRDSLCRLLLWNPNKSLSSIFFKHYWPTVCKNGSPYAIRPLTLVCLSVTLVHCGQTVGWIKMKLGMEVGLGPGHTAADGDPIPTPKSGHSSPPNFWPMSVVAKRLDGSKCHFVGR